MFTWLNTVGSTYKKAITIQEWLFNQINMACLMSLNYYLARRSLFSTSVEDKLVTCWYNFSVST